MAPRVAVTYLAPNYLSGTIVEGSSSTVTDLRKNITLSTGFPKRMRPFFLE